MRKLFEILKKRRTRLLRSLKNFLPKNPSPRKDARETCATVIARLSSAKCDKGCPPKQSHRILTKGKRDCFVPSRIFYLRAPRLAKTHAAEEEKGKSKRDLQNLSPLTFRACCRRLPLTAYRLPVEPLAPQRRKMFPCLS